MKIKKSTYIVISTFILFIALNSNEFTPTLLFSNDWNHFVSEFYVKHPGILAINLFVIIFWAALHQNLAMKKLIEK